MKLLSTHRRFFILLIVPLILLGIDNRWIFAPISHTDTWVYFGFFTNLRQHLHLFSYTYFGDRLSWTLPGAVIYSIFPAIPADLILHLGAYYVAVFSFYCTLQLNFEPDTALIASILFGTHTLFLRAIGWNNIDGIGDAYFLLTICMLTCSAKLPRKRLYLFLAGLAFAATFYSNVIWLSVSPLLAGYYLFLTGFFRRPRLGRLIVPVNTTLAAFVLVTLVFAAIYYVLSGGALFFASSLGATAYYMNVPNQFIVDWNYWIPRASWLVFPVILLFSAVFYLWVYYRRRTGNKENDSTIAAFQWMYIGFWIVWLIWQIPINHPIFQTGYFVSFMLPCAFLAFGALIYFYAHEWIHNHFWLATALTLTLMAVPLVSVVWLTPFFEASASYAVLLPLIFGVIGIIIFLARRPIGTQTFVIALIFLSVANVLVHNATTIIQILNEKEIPQDVGTSDQYLTIYDSMRMIQKYVPDGEVYFWYNSQDVLPYKALYRSVASTYTWWNRYIKSDFPQFTDWTTEIPNGATITILSQHAGNAATANSVLNQVGISTKFVSEETVQHGPLELVLTFMRVVHNVQQTTVTF